MQALHKFFKRHPMWPVIIPAVLILYFVYISLGWNVWVSVSDWARGDLTASYGWGGFGNYRSIYESDLTEIDFDTYAETLEMLVATGDPLIFNDYGKFLEDEYDDAEGLSPIT